jgi:hypothetical protein
MRCVQFVCFPFSSPRLCPLFFTRLQRCLSFFTIHARLHLRDSLIQVYQTSKVRYRPTLLVLDRNTQQDGGTEAPSRERISMESDTSRARGCVIANFAFRLPHPQANASALASPARTPIRGPWSSVAALHRPTLAHSLQRQPHGPPFTASPAPAHYRPRPSYH